MARVGRTWIAVAGVSVVAVAVAVAWLAAPRAPSMAEVRKALSTQASQVGVRIAVDRPDRPGETETFTGSGVIFEDGRADLTYDFSTLPNAGGFFGHLSKFQILIDQEHLYLEVLPGDSWLVVEEADFPEFARADVERLGEAVLASPHLLGALLRGDELTGGPDTVGVASSPSELLEEGDGFSLTILEYLDRIGADPIRSIFTVDSDSAPITVRYELSFPVVKNAADKTVVTVIVDFQEVGIDAEFHEPEEAETKTFSELKGELND